MTDLDPDLDLNRRRLLAALAALAAGSALLATPATRAQAFPNKPLRLIVGFAPGGAADVMARIVAKGLGGPSSASKSSWTTSSAPTASWPPKS